MDDSSFSTNCTLAYLALLFCFSLLAKAGFPILIWILKNKRESAWDPAPPQWPSLEKIKENTALLISGRGWVCPCNSRVWYESRGDTAIFCLLEQETERALYAA